MNYFQYVPSMESNLINLGQLLDMNYTMRLTDKELKVFDASSKLILKLPLSNKKKPFKIMINMFLPSMHCVNHN